MYFSKPLALWLIAFIFISLPSQLPAQPQEQYQVQQQAQKPDHKPRLTLANVYQQQNHKIDLQHYWVSEKYDGVRAYWNGHQLISRQGNVLHAPAWFIAELPSFPLDGELWLGRQRFDQLSGFVRKNQPIDSEWEQVRYMVFDQPSLETVFTNRLKRLHTYSDFPRWVSVAKQWRVSSESMLLKQLDEFVAQGAEGLMLHDGRSLYQAKRNNDLLKLKPSLDAEATVLSYIEGKGKYSNQMGAIWVKAKLKDEQGKVQQKIFKIGSGFSDFERKYPPAVGSEITFKYSGLTSKGIPRFARFWRLKNKER